MFVFCVVSSRDSVKVSSVLCLCAKESKTTMHAQFEEMVSGDSVFWYCGLSYTQAEEKKQTENNICL